MVTAEQLIEYANKIVADTERSNHPEIPTNRVEPETFHPRRTLAKTLRIGGTAVGGLIGAGIFAGVLDMQYAALTFPIVLTSAGLGWYLGDVLAKKFLPADNRNPRQ